ncbi:MAG: hypothetical protein KTR31_13695 [Myxococcales bacterium]|nr:hypothetical protein [Myxococcales bacterium]
MTWWWVMLSCGRSPVPGVPEGAVHVSVRGPSLSVGRSAVGPWAEIGEQPTAGTYEPLTQALEPHRGKATWLEVPGATEFFVLRKLIGSAQHVEAASVTLSRQGAEHAWTLAAPPSYGLKGTCPDGPLTVHGAMPLVSLSLQTGEDGTWLLGTARFLPVVDHQGERTAVDGLPEACLKPVDCGALHAAGSMQHGVCEAARAGEVHAPERVRLGNETGCLAPIVRSDEQLPAWREGWQSTVRQLGLDSQELLLVMPEARVKLEVLLAVLAGFARQEPPAVATMLLLQGNDGPPVCNASVRDRSSLDYAMAAWLGTLGAEPPG